MQVHDALPNTIRSTIHSGFLFALSPREPMQPQKVAILGLHDVLFGRVSP